MSGDFEQTKSRVSQSEGAYVTVRPLASSWEQRKLGEFSKKKTTKNADGTLSETFTNSAEQGVISQLDYFDHDITNDANINGYYVVQPDDFVYNPRISVTAPCGPINRNRLNRAGVMSPLYTVFSVNPSVDKTYLEHYFKTSRWHGFMFLEGNSGARSDRFSISDTTFFEMPIWCPEISEQRAVAKQLETVDSLIALHQREPPHNMMKEGKMPISINEESLFCDYYSQWISVYKEGAIREVTMGKYRLTQSWLAKLIPDLKIKDLDRTSYQQLINGYAEHHERQTTMDFHHQLKGAILDAVDEGLIPRDPTRKAIIKGKQPRAKKIKYLNQFELHAMLGDLDLSGGPSWDWLILIVAKTGLRFSEALGLTPEDFDFAHQTLSVNKTWDYKNGGGFVPTKNASSVRKVQLDWQLIMQLSGLLKDLPPTEPIFAKGKVYNSTANSVLARHCKNVGVPVISVHGLRHTHASLLLFAGVSIASVSRRLGHASMTTTQETYLHVIQELENKDIDIVMRALSTLI